MIMTDDWRAIVFTVADQLRTMMDDVSYEIWTRPGFDMSFSLSAIQIEMSVQP
jgi:hypothetical protein